MIPNRDYSEIFLLDRQRENERKEIIKLSNIAKELFKNIKKDFSFESELLYF